MRGISVIEVNVSRVSKEVNCLLQSSLDFCEI